MAATDWSALDLPVDEGTTPSTATLLLGLFGTTEVGLWSMEPGEADDVEADELALVVAGRATITSPGQPDVEVGPGSLLRLQAGTPTHWSVHERLTKLFVIGA